MLKTLFGMTALFVLARLIGLINISWFAIFFPFMLFIIVLAIILTIGLIVILKE